jgi:hypothetical protein
MEEITINSLTITPDNFGEICQNIALTMSVFATGNVRVDGIISVPNALINCGSVTFSEDLIAGNNNINIPCQYRFQNAIQAQITVKLTPQGGGTPKSNRANVFNNQTNFILHLDASNSFTMNEIADFEDGGNLLSNPRKIHKILKHKGFTFNNKLKKWTK